MTYKAEKIVPYNTGERKVEQVERMFDEIAGKYDTLNHTLSMGIDKRWRKKGIRSIADLRPQHILDIATGTGDLALEAYRYLKPRKITGIDISERMMEIGRKKVEAAGLPGKIVFEKQDCTNLSFPDNSMDAAIVAFGVRNFENLDKALQEILRVLNAGGKLAILELSTPEKFPMKQLYAVYSRFIIPTIGRLISRNGAAYKYLPQSIAAFPQGKEMKGILDKNGYINTYVKTFTFGICSLYVGQKKQ